MTHVAIGREEMVPRTEKAITTLTAMANATVDADNRTRLLNKAEGMQLVLNAQRERFQHMKNAEDVITLAAMIVMDYEPKHEAGVKLVQGYLMEYAQD